VLEAGLDIVLDVDFCLSGGQVVLQLVLSILGLFLVVVYLTEIGLLDVCSLVGPVL